LRSIFVLEAAFTQDSARALQDIRLQTSPDDVVAFLPSELTERPLWGHTEICTNYSITAMTGLDGYFSPRTFCISFAVSGLSGSSPADVLAQADRLCQQRRDDVESWAKGDITDAGFGRLVDDHVKWVVVSGDALRDISTSAIPWRKTPQVTVYHSLDKARARPVSTPIKPSQARWAECSFLGCDRLSYQIHFYPVTKDK
jgi:hypothetical protein